MSDTISAGKSAQETIARIQARKLGLPNASVDIADVRTYVDEYTKISKLNNWEQMSVSTAQGAAAASLGFWQSAFDGRYIYYSPYNSDTFLRFDTQGTSLITEGDWQKMDMSTAQGGAALEAAYRGCIFDGRYIYYDPFKSDTFLRFDTQGTSFTTVADWQTMDMSTAQRAAALDDAYTGATFDGRYVYFSPYNSDTFLRFDTQGISFTTAGDWEQMDMSTAMGASALNVAYYDIPAFDGRYVYFTPYVSDTLLRFDTQGTSFTTEADWERTVQGGSSTANTYAGAVFDGRYIYYTPVNSNTFLCFDTQGTSFGTAGDWKQIAMATAQGGAALDIAYLGGITWDGRYVYFSPYNSDTFLKFDTQGTSFSTAADWTQMSMSTAQGGSPGSNVYAGGSFDGKYIYYCPFGSVTFIRALATPKAYK